MTDTRRSSYGFELAASPGEYRVKDASGRMIGWYVLICDEWRLYPREYPCPAVEIAAAFRSVLTDRQQIERAALRATQLPIRELSRRRAEEQAVRRRAAAGACPGGPDELPTCRIDSAWEAYVARQGSEPMRWPDRACPATLCWIAEAHGWDASGPRDEWLSLERPEDADRRLADRYRTTRRGLRALLEAHGFKDVDDTRPRRTLPMDLMLYSGPMVLSGGAHSRAPPWRPAVLFGAPGRRPGASYVPEPWLVWTPGGLATVHPYCDQGAVAERWRPSLDGRSHRLAHYGLPCP